MTTTITDRVLDRFTHRKEALVIILLLGIALITQVTINPDAIPFKQPGKGDVLAIISSMFVVAVFMERAIESFLIPYSAILVTSTHRIKCLQGGKSGG